MQTKLFEIRDSATLIPAVGILLSRRDGPLVQRAGYGDEPCVLLTYLIGGRNAECDPYAWIGRTMPVAHRYISEHWQELESGAVVDVEFILGMSLYPKKSEYAG